jgi:hypothetical protein
MELRTLLDTVHEIQVTYGGELPAWLDDVTVRGRTASPRHVVCVGVRGHGACFAARTRMPPEDFSVAALARRGNGGSRVVCTGGFDVTVQLTEFQSDHLAVLRAGGTAMVLRRAAATAALDPEASGDLGPDQLAVLAASAYDDLVSLAGTDPSFAEVVARVDAAAPAPAVS